MDEITNFYLKSEIKKYNRKLPNPCFNRHQINVPFRISIVGSSGSGKSNVALEILHRMGNTFNLLVVCCKSKEEPLYQYIAEKLQGYVIFYENGDVPPISDIEVGGNEQMLIIFDDLCLKKDQKDIEEYFIRGRKKNISMMYISQSYFKIPKSVRLNSNYIILKKLSSTRDLNMILGDFNLGVNKQTLLNLYKAATNNPLDFLMIDVDNTAEKRFRHNFLSVISLC